MKQHPPLRITTYLFRFHFLPGIVGIAFVAAFALFAIYTTGQQQVKSDAERRSLFIAQSIEDPVQRVISAPKSDSSPVFREIHETIQVALADLPGFQYGIYADGKVLLASSPDVEAMILTELPPEVQAAQVKHTGYARRENSQGEEFVYTAVALQQDGRSFVVFQLGIPYASAMTPTYQWMFMVGVAAVLFTLVMWAAARRTTAYLSAPLVELNRAVHQLSQGDLQARAEQKGPLELIQLSESLNNVSTRLQTSLESMHTFVANASHELRTPLTGIKLQVGALRAGAVEEPELADRFLKQIDCEIDRLVKLVNDMLDLSQIEGNAPAAAAQAVNLTDLAYEVQAFWEVRAQQAGIDLTLQTQPGLPPVKGDACNLRRVFDNLLANAIKYTPTGGEVRIILRAGRAAGMVRMEVCDTGVGIAPEHLPNLFDRFYRVTQTSESSLVVESTSCCGEQSGSGLGLSIAKSIVVTHGGQIGVESSPGKGSTFWAELPVWNNQP